MTYLKWKVLTSSTTTEWIAPFNDQRQHLLLSQIVINEAECVSHDEQSMGE